VYKPIQLADGSMATLLTDQIHFVELHDTSLRMPHHRCNSDSASHTHFRRTLLTEISRCLQNRANQGPDPRSGDLVEEAQEPREG
jgi:hypothetical protein